MNTPWSLDPPIKVQPVYEVRLSEVFEISSEPVSPTPKANILVIFLTAYSSILVSSSLFPSPSSFLSNSFIYLKASKGLIDILLMDTLIFSKGVRAVV